MLEKYYKYKAKYKEYIIMIKYGNFYEILDNDSLIMNSLFNYKLVKLSNTFKVGFPVSKIDSVLKKLDDNSINYIVVDKDKIINIKEFEYNNYKKYNFDNNIINYNSIIINEITKYLNDNLLNNNITLKLERIKEIINE